MQPQTYTSSLPFMVGWIDPNGGNDPAGGGEHKQGSTTVGNRTVQIPECRVWYVEPRPEIDGWTWPDVLNEVQNSQIPGLSAGHHIDDAVLSEVGKLTHLIHLDLTRCKTITDQGLLQLSDLQNLEALYLNGCAQITDRGLQILRLLPNLKVVRLCGLPNITDAGIAHLQHHQHLQLVTLSGSNVGNQAIHYLSNKPTLAHFNPGNKTTDDGLAVLAQFPGLTTYRPNGPKHKINEYAEPSTSNFGMDLRGNMPITNNGLVHLSVLDGVYEFSLGHQHENSAVTGAGAEHVAKMKNLRTLRWADQICTDEALLHIATIPHLEQLWSYGAQATDIGFEALETCQNLRMIFASGHITQKTIKALSRLPKLTRFHIDGTHLDDDSLAPLSQYPALTQLSPTRFGEAAYRHIGNVRTLERLTNMYSNDTADLATEYISGLPNLKAYSIWTTQITDRSLERLSAMSTLEKLLFQKCPHITDAGLSKLTQLPNLKTLDLQKCKGLTPAGLEGFRSDVQINYQPAA